jgi:hypothetical protein
MLYLTGNIAEKSTFEAVKLLQDNWHLLWATFMIKCYSVGSSLQRGVVLEADGDISRALLHYKAGSESGDRESVIRYGTLLLLHGFESSGVFLLELFAQAGDIQANCTLGDYYYRWKSDRVAALRYFKNVADLSCSPFFSEPYLIVGHLLGEMGNVTDAQPYLDKHAEIEQTLAHHSMERPVQRMRHHTI